MARLGLLENWRVKLTAVSLACVFWFAVVTGSDFEYELDLPVVATDIPRGKTLAQPLPATARVRVEGKGRTLLALIFHRDASVNIDCSGIQRQKRVALGREMVQPPRRGEDIVAKEILYPDSVLVELVPLLERRVPVIAAIDIQTVAGYILASPVVVKPESVTVEGPEHQVRSLDHISTATSRFTDARTIIKQRLPLVAPEGSASLRLSATSVEVFADVQKLIEVTLSEIPVEVRNVPPSLHVTVIPSTVSLTLEGAERLLLDLNREDIHVYIDYDRATRESQALGHPAYISVPEGVRYREVTPERFTLSVEKLIDHAPAGR